MLLQNYSTDKNLNSRWINERKMKYLDEFLLMVFGTSKIDDGGFICQVRNLDWKSVWTIYTGIHVCKEINFFIHDTNCTYVNIKQTVWICNEIRKEHRIDKDNVACVCKEMYIVIDISKVIGS